MDYFGALGVAFRSPRWGINLLSGSILLFLPIVGPLVLLGYMGSVVDILMKDPRAAPPEFDWDQFVPYLTRGFWFLLPTLVAWLAMLPVWLLVALPPALIPAFHLEGPVVLLPVSLMGLLAIGVAIATILVITPLGLRALVLQDFSATFSVAFINDFIRRVWAETLLATLFLGLAGFFLGLFGMALCCVGFYPASVVQMYAQWALTAQLYRLHLQRGGMPIQPKLEAVDWA
jgi:hypothetical protein